MKYKKSLIFICFIICLFSIASVCASDVNQTAVTDDEINLESNSDAISESLDSKNSDDVLMLASEENNTLNVNDDTEILSEDKQTTSIVTSDFTTNYNKADYLKATLNDNQNNPISGVVLTVSLNGDKNYETDANGQIEIPTVDLNAGEYNVNINFAGSEKYAPSSAAAKITVNRIDSSLSNINLPSLDCDSEVNVTVTVYGATGITAKIDDSDISVSGLKIIIPQLDVGTHNLYVTTIPDGNHNSVTKTVTLTVNKAVSLMRVDEVTLNYGNSSKVKVATMGAKAITAQIDGNDVSVNGFEISIPLLDAGTHTLTVTAIPDESHLTATQSATITVKKVDSSIGISDLTLDYGTGYNFTVTTIGVSKFTAQIDGKSVNVEGNVIMLPQLDAGTHTLTVTTTPDKNHNAVTKTSKITVNKVDFLSDINDVTLEYGDSYNMEVNTAGTAKITAQIDGKDLTVVENVIIFPKLEVGTHTLTVSTVKDANHNVVTKNAIITVGKAKTSLITHSLNATAGRKVNLTVGMAGISLIDEGVVTFFNGETKIGQTNVDDGIAKLIYTPLNAGKYSISVVYSGTSRFESSKSSFQLTVLENSNPSAFKNSSALISFDGSSGNVSVEIKMPGDATGTVIFIVDAVEYTSNLSGGACKIKLNDLDDGVYQYTIIYSGDDQYVSFSDGGSFNVTKTSETPRKEIEFRDLVGLSSGDTVQMSLPSDATGTVTLNINGQSYEYPIENGTATLKIPNFGDVNYPFNVTYSGDSNYLPFTKSGTLVKSAAIDAVITAKSVSVVYGAGSIYTIKVSGTDGKLVNGAAVKITGKISLNLKTTNGIAKFRISQVPGTYKITITSLGKSVTKTITVKHIVTLKSVTVKKSAKKLTLQASLAKVNGKYLNKKTVTFKFNGKKYTAKTNSKGVAKVTIKSSVLKKLNVGKKLTYQATYLKDTVKKTVVIKK